MPTPSNVPDTEPDGEGGRLAWWRRLLRAMARTLGRGFGGRGNQQGTYRGLGREYRQAARAGRRRDLFRD